MEDVYAAINGKSDFVRLPIPLGGHPPIHSLSLIGTSRDMPHQVNIGISDNPVNVPNMSRRMFCRYASSQNQAYTTQNVKQDPYGFMSGACDTEVNDEKEEVHVTGMTDLVDSISDEIKSISEASKAHSNADESDDDNDVSINPSVIPKTLDVDIADNMTEGNSPPRIPGRRRINRRNIM